MAEKNAMLVMRDVSKTFNPGTVNEKCALKNLNLTLKQGDFATIVGSNGAGKSTLFNAITGAFFADKGLIMLDGEDITYQKEHVRSKVIGHLFQDPLKAAQRHLLCHWSGAGLHHGGPVRCADRHPRSAPDR